MKPASIPAENVESPKALASHTAGLTPDGRLPLKDVGWIWHVKYGCHEWHWEVYFGLGRNGNFTDATGDRIHMEADGSRIATSVKLIA